MQVLSFMNMVPLVCSYLGGNMRRARKVRKTRSTRLFHAVVQMRLSQVTRNLLVRRTRKAR